MTSETLHVEHMRMEMAQIFQEVDRLGGLAFRAAKRSFDITAAAVGMVRVHILSRIPETHLAKPTFRAVCA